MSTEDFEQLLWDDFEHPLLVWHAHRLTNEGKPLHFFKTHMTRFWSRLLTAHCARNAGAGRMGDGTQYTVNNQMVNATLMNIADAPTNVQLPGVYKTEEVCGLLLF